MLEAALICRAVVPTCAQHGEITRITAEVSKPDEWFAASRPFHRIVIYAERRGADKFIDVSLKHLLAEGIRESCARSVSHRPDLEFPPRWTLARHEVLLRLRGHRLWPTALARTSANVWYHRGHALLEPDQYPRSDSLNARQCSFRGTTGGQWRLSTRAFNGCTTRDVC